MTDSSVSDNRHLLTSAFPPIFSSHDLTMEIFPAIFRHIPQSSVNGIEGLNVSSLPSVSLNHYTIMRLKSLWLATGNITIICEGTRNNSDKKQVWFKLRSETFLCFKLLADSAQSLKIESCGKVCQRSSLWLEFVEFVHDSGLCEERRRVQILVRIRFSLTAGI